jgi:hypothetical protein
MSAPQPTPAPLTFDAFWKWLSEHRNCVVRAGSADAMLFDHDLCHWEFLEEEDGRAVIQQFMGKALLGEVVIERSDVLFVQASPDMEEPGQGQWSFECLGGPREDSYPLYSFVMTHGLEQAQSHQLKH